MYDASRHVCFNLSRAVRRIQNYYQRRLAPVGLTAPQFFVLNALWGQDGLNFRDLAERVGLDGSTLTGMIDRLEKNDLVERRPDVEDRRSVRLHLTVKAQLLLPQLFRITNELDGILKKPFTEDDIRAFERVLDQIGENLG